MQAGEDTLLVKMIERFDQLTNYTALLDSEGLDGRNRIIYSYQKPGFIRMDFIQPHEGARLIYNPKTNKISVRFFSTNYLNVWLDPGNSVIVDPKGHTVDKSDIGSFLQSLVKEAREGAITTFPSE